MRLLKAHPIVKEKIAEGTISLSQAADINRFIKAEAESVSVSSATFAQTEGRAISVMKIIEEVAGKSGRESKDLLDKMRSAPKAKTYSIEVDEEAWTILQEIKKKESSTSRDGEFTKKILKERLEKLNELHSKKENKKKNITEKPKDKIIKTSNSRFIGKIKRAELLQEANYQCQYISPLTGRRCDCKTDLEVDHLYPFAWGGNHDKNNTRILCRSHNLFYGVQTFGKEKMANFRHQ